MHQLHITGFLPCCDETEKFQKLTYISHFRKKTNQESEVSKRGKAMRVSIPHEEVWMYTRRYRNVEIHNGRHGITDHDELKAKLGFMFVSQKTD